MHYSIWTNTAFAGMFYLTCVSLQALFQIYFLDAVVDSATLYGILRIALVQAIGGGIGLSFGYMIRGSVRYAKHAGAPQRRRTRNRTYTWSEKTSFLLLYFCTVVSILVLSRVFWSHDAIDKSQAEAVLFAAFLLTVIAVAANNFASSHFRKHDESSQRSTD